MRELYWVAVPTGVQGDSIRQAGSARDQRDKQRQTSEGFIVEATAAEIESLYSLFHQMEVEDRATFGVSFVPFLKPEIREERNRCLDSKVDEIYRALYHLGTPATRSQMEESGIVAAGSSADFIAPESPHSLQ